MTATLHTLSNGVRVIADPMPSLESAALTVVTGAGARYEDARTNGWSHLLEHMVFKGAGGRTSRAIVEAIEQEGGWINAATGYERTSFQVRHLAGGLPLAMSVLADLLRRPTLDPAELEREKGVIAQEIAEATDTPDDQVFEMAQTAAFTDQPLGRPILGSEATLAPVDVAALEGWRAALYGDPSRLVISAAGAVDEAELLAAAEAAFGDLAAPPAPLTSAQAGRFTGGDTSEARKLEQAHLVMLLPGVGVRDPGWAVQRLFAEVLGGGMASRLFQEARETRGLCYAVDAYSESYADTGLLGHLRRHLRQGRHADGATGRCRAAETGRAGRACGAVACQGPGPLRPLHGPRAAPVSGRAERRAGHPVRPADAACRTGRHG